MAKVELELPFAGFHGRLDHDSEKYYTHRYGKTIVSNYPLHKDPAKITDRQRACHSAFQAAVRSASSELADPVRRAYWQDLFDHQPEPRKYHILRNFVIAKLSFGQKQL